MMSFEDWIRSVQEHRCANCKGKRFLVVKEPKPFRRREKRIRLVCTKCSEGYVGYPAPR